MLELPQWLYRMFQRLVQKMSGAHLSEMAFELLVPQLVAVRHKPRSYNDK